MTIIRIHKQVTQEKIEWSYCCDAFTKAMDSHYNMKTHESTSRLFVYSNNTFYIHRDNTMSPLSYCPFCGAKTDIRDTDRVEITTEY